MLVNFNEFFTKVIRKKKVPRGTLKVYKFKCFIFGLCHCFFFCFGFIFKSN
jgi:hypothetical protein